MSATNQTLVKGAIDFSEILGAPGSAWEWNDASFELAVGGSTLVEGVADAQASMWLTSLDDGYKVEVTNALLRLDDDG